MQFVGAARSLSVNSGDGGCSKFVKNDCFSLEKEVPESLAWGKGRIQVHFTIFRIRSELCDLEIWNRKCDSKFCKV